jgi:hypothetical protein
LRCDVHKSTAGEGVKPEFFSEGFHNFLSLKMFDGLISKIIYSGLSLGELR